MRALLCPTLPLRKPTAGAVALPLSIVVDIVEVSRLGEGERMLRVEDSLKVGYEFGRESGTADEFEESTVSGKRDDKMDT